MTDVLGPLIPVGVCAACLLAAPLLLAALGLALGAWSGLRRRRRGRAA